jgi:hypothetical protein
MNRDRALLGCEKVLRKLDVALEAAHAEVNSATAAEKQLRRVRSRLLAQDKHREPNSGTRRRVGDFNAQDPQSKPYH